MSADDKKRKMISNKAVQPNSPAEAMKGLNRSDKETEENLVPGDENDKTYSSVTQRIVSLPLHFWN